MKSDQRGIPLFFHHPILSGYRQIKRVVSLTLVMVFVIGLCTLAFSKGEVFPFFSWSMFALTPQTKTKFALVIHEFHGHVLHPPKFYEEADGILPDPHSVIAYKLIQQLGIAKESGQIQEINRLRHMFEQNFFRPPGRYELVKTEYDPLHRWKSGHIKIHSLSMFVAGEFPP